ncbi:MAG TPA: formyltetrahydrofolate deformylase [Bacteroidales bacterium]|nr:formyltetrahydrofolate deformylase [Bacteroidales bacterium]
MSDNSNTAILLLSCADRQGLVSRISSFISENGGNIINLNEHVDVNGDIFFLRVSWDISGFTIAKNGIEEAIAALVPDLDAFWKLHFANINPRAALFVSKYDHCFRDILWRNSMGEFSLDIPLIISNSPDLEPIADRYGIPFHVFPITPESKAFQEDKELDLLRESGVDFIILARYMQILSPKIVDEYPNNIINIHHSFLPAFVGSNPYRQAYERGVKIIGATSHFVTEELDQGPIIEQNIERITHRDTVKDLIRKGRDLERLVLARAVRLHSEHRILVHGSKTIVFE